MCYRCWNDLPPATSETIPHQTQQRTSKDQINLTLPPLTKSASKSSKTMTEMMLQFSAQFDLFVSVWANMNDGDEVVSLHQAQTANISFHLSWKSCVSIEPICCLLRLRFSRPTRSAVQQPKISSESQQSVYRAWHVCVFVSLCYSDLFG